MARVRTAFSTAAKAPGRGYLTASLNFMAADTRHGMSPDDRRNFDVIRDYARRNPDRADVAGYVSRMEREAQAPAPSRPAAPRR